MLPNFSSSQLDLSWDTFPDDDFSYYKVYCDGIFVSTIINTIYSDIELSPSTTYLNEVSVVDTSGNEELKSDTVSRTTAPPSTTDTVHVYSIEMWYDTYSWWFFVWYDVYIEVIIYDGDSLPESGVTVYIDLQLPGGGVLSNNGLTGADGSITFLYESSLFEFGWYTATVTNLVKAGLTYIPEDNLETSDSLYVS